MLYHARQRTGWPDSSTTRPDSGQTTTTVATTTTTFVHYAHIGNVRVSVLTTLIRIKLCVHAHYSPRQFLSLSYVFAQRSRRTYAHASIITRAIAISTRCQAEEEEEAEETGGAHHRSAQKKRKCSATADCLLGGLRARARCAMLRIHRLGCSICVFFRFMRGAPSMVRDVSAIVAIVIHSIIASGRPVG